MSTASAINMVRGITLKRDLEGFFKKFPDDKLLQLNDDFISEVEAITNKLSILEISFTSLVDESCMLKILEQVSKIMGWFNVADIIEPISNNNFVIYMKLSQHIVNFKSMILSEIIDDICDILAPPYMFDYKLEQCICDTYKSKLERFKFNCSEEEVQTANNHFTYFLLEFLKFLSNLVGKVPIEKNFELLSEVGDIKILVENIHSISHLIPKTKRVPIFQKITNFCVKKNFDLQNCKFIQSVDKDFELETSIMSYFTLLHICKHLELQNLHQTSQILTMFKIEDIMFSIGSVKSDPEYEKLYEESVKLITFKTYKKVKVLPLHKIKKCLNILQVLLDSYSGRQLQNCPFAIIILSILSEFIMATDLDKSTIISLIDLVNGYLGVCKLPSDFMAVSYAFKIYQKLKLDDDLETKSLSLCKCLSSNLGVHKQKLNLKDDFETVLKCEEDWLDKSIVISYFLSNIDDLCISGDETLNKYIHALNETIIVSSLCIDSNALLVYPYSVSLHLSIVNKNADTLFNNFALLDDYLNIVFEETETVRSEDKKYFLSTILRHYNVIVDCLPEEFLVKCWKCVFNPQNMDTAICKTLLQYCSSKVLTIFIESLKNETVKIIEGKDSTINEDYYLHIHQLWSSLLNMQFLNKKKKVRKDYVNHFCYILNRSYIFDPKKIGTEQGLVLLLKLACSLLKIPWINITTLMNYSLRIITFVERRSCISDVKLLTETAELLIVLYKCPNNSIKPYLGLYVITFVNVLKKCWSFIQRLIDIDTVLVTKDLYLPFHKLDKCSSLFKQNKNDFNIISRFVIQSSIELVVSKNQLPEGFMRHFHNIIFNLMDVCSPEEMKQLILNIQGPALIVLRNAHQEYRSNIRFSGRL